MDILALAVIGLLAICVAAIVGPRLGIAAPLLLTAIGIVVSLLPFMPPVQIEPEWILAGVIPPLLYSAAVSMPTMEFRRDFTAISALSIILVVLCSVVLGLLFAWLIPGLGLAWGIALGAIISPTDAVAITIVKQLGVAPRVVVVLEGESLLNDATALVVLRSAIAGAAAAVSLWGVVGDFFYAVGVAVAIGLAVGWLTLRVRARIKDSTVNTVISFTIPFVASIPAEHLGASGLVAAVVAGLVTGRGAPRFLSPRHRLSDAQNWSAIELILEGAVFLLMGLELRTVVSGVQADQLSIGPAVGIAALALLATIVIRAGYLAPLLAALGAQSRHGAGMKDQLATMQDQINATGAVPIPENTPAWLKQARASRGSGPQQQARQERYIERFRTRIQRALADIDYMLAEPIGWREGAIIVWSGMRGAVTLAAAQTLPEDTPSRSLLIFIAFLVAVGSLLLQGGTLAQLIKALKPAGPDPQVVEAEHKHLRGLLESTALEVLEHMENSPAAKRMLEYLTTGQDLATTLDSYHSLQLKMIRAQRTALLAAQDKDEFSAAVLSAALETLDADQISLDLKGTTEA